MGQASQAHAAVICNERRREEQLAGTGGAEEIDSTRVAELEARLANAEQEREIAVREAFAKGQQSVSNDGAARGEPETEKEMRQRLRDMEGQLARAEGSAAALQDAASRAAEKLQAQAVRERELEARLAGIGSVDGANWGVRAALGVVGGVGMLVNSATSRCLRPNRELDQEGQSLTAQADAPNDGPDAIGTPTHD